MEIFKKLYLKNEENAIKDILETYEKNSFVIVNYLYFANIISNGIIWNKPLNKEYFDALISWDFLLPDGIALRLYAKKYFSLDLENLNWTDFSINFLNHIKSNNYNLVLYWAKPGVLEISSKNILQNFWLKTFYFQDGYREFDFEKLNDLPKNSINILMVGLWTPLQEIWIKNNLENIKKYNLIVFSQGWTFDFWAWNEKRAPQIFINLKLEWLWRFITNPKKNFKKVLYSFYLFYYLYKKK